MSVFNLTPQEQAKLAASFQQEKQISESPAAPAQEEISPDRAAEIKRQVRDDKDISGAKATFLLSLLDELTFGGTEMAASFVDYLKPGMTWDEARLKNALEKDKANRAKSDIADMTTNEILSEIIKKLDSPKYKKNYDDFALSMSYEKDENRIVFEQILKNLDGIVNYLQIREIISMVHKNF